MKLTSTFVLISFSINCFCKKDIISISIDNDKVKDSFENDDKKIKIEISQARNQSHENIIPISIESGSLEKYEKTVIQEQRSRELSENENQEIDAENNSKYTGKILSSIEETSNLWKDSLKDKAYSTKMRSEPQTDNIFRDKVTDSFENSRNIPPVMARTFSENNPTLRNNLNQDVTQNNATTNKDKKYMLKMPNDNRKPEDRRYRRKNIPRYNHRFRNGQTEEKYPKSCENMANRKVTENQIGMRSGDAHIVDAQDKSPCESDANGPTNTVLENNSKYTVRKRSSVEETSNLWKDTIRDSIYYPKIRPEPQSHNKHHNDIKDDIKDERNIPAVMAINLNRDETRKYIGNPKGPINILRTNDNSVKKYMFKMPNDNRKPEDRRDRKMRLRKGLLNSRRNLIFWGTQIEPMLGRFSEFREQSGTEKVTEEPITLPSTNGEITDAMDQMPFENNNMNGQESKLGQQQKENQKIDADKRRKFSRKILNAVADLWDKSLKDRKHSKQYNPTPHSDDMFHGKKMGPVYTRNIPAIMPKTFRGNIRNQGTPIIQNNFTNNGRRPKKYTFRMPNDNRKRKNRRNRTMENTRRNWRFWDKPIEAMEDKFSGLSKASGNEKVREEPNALSNTEAEVIDVMDKTPLENYENKSTGTELVTQQEQSPEEPEKEHQDIDGKNTNKYPRQIINAVKNLWEKSIKERINRKMKAGRQSDGISHGYEQNSRKTPAVMARRFNDRKENILNQDTPKNNIANNGKGAKKYMFKMPNDNRNPQDRKDRAMRRNKSLLNSRRLWGYSQIEPVFENFSESSEKSVNENVTEEPVASLKTDPDIIDAMDEIPGEKDNSDGSTELARSNSSTIEVSDREYQERITDQESYSDAHETLDDYPYSASIQRKGAHYASGALVGERWILSTAAEFYNVRESIKLFRVRVGSVNCKKGGTLTPVVQIAIHPKFSPNRPAYDISVLKTAKILPPSSFIKPIGLSRVSGKVVSAKFLTSYWPRIVSKKGVMPPAAKERLKHNSMRVSTQKLVPTEECSLKLAPINVTLDKNSLCLRPIKIHHSECMPDPGAPVVAVDGLWGITSGWVTPLCPAVISPTIFTRVSTLDLRAWINEQMRL